ncbi:MAG TPA: glycosyltransferase [Chthoniobacterales bacterium]
MTFRRTKFVDVELSHPIPNLRGLQDYATVRILVRVGGTPVGFVTIRGIGDPIPAKDLRRLILDELASPIMMRYAEAALANGPLRAAGIPVQSLAHFPPGENAAHFPPVTVAVCTRNRSEDLSLCLNSLVQIDYPNLDLIVVDNAPLDDSTRRLVESKFPSVRYICEPRPGLDWARNRAVLAAKGEIVAYTDDDVVADPGWIKALVTRFNDAPNVMCVTGLVIPYEMETEAQELFERYGGFGRGFKRGWFRKPGRPSRGGHGKERSDEQPLGEEEKAVEKELRYAYYGTGIFGTGCNMAYRRSFLEGVGGFDPALDVGTPTRGGGDLDMYFRVLREGHALAYEPSAIIRHRHRREREKLVTQIGSNGVGFFSYLLRITQKYPSERLPVARFALWWLLAWDVKRLLKSFLKPGFFPRDLILAEFATAFQAPHALRQSRARAAEIERDFPDEPVLKPTRSSFPPVVASGGKSSHGVRTVELTEPMQPLTDIIEFPTTLITVSLAGRILGQFELVNAYRACGVLRLRDAIVSHCGEKLFTSDTGKPITPSDFRVALADRIWQLEDNAT